MARSIEAAQSFPEEIDKWETVSKNSRDIALQYSLQREEESIIAAWEKILEKNSS